MSNQMKIALLVEDDENDVFFMERALEQAGIELTIRVARTGADALEYLERRGQFADHAANPLPDIIFLDLKLPYFNGFQILQRIRADAKLSGIPVFILTSSPDERDERRARELGSMGYLMKPPDKDTLASAFANLFQPAVTT